MKNKKILFYFLVFVVIIGFLKFLQIKSQEKFLNKQEILNLCIEHTKITYHIHPIIKIYLNEKEIKIPENIGIEDNCMRPIHTHNDPPKVHIEAPLAYNFRLSDFFRVWNKEFSQNNILGYRRDQGYNFKIFINKKESEKFDPVLKNGFLYEIKISK